MNANWAGATDGTSNIPLPEAQRDELLLALRVHAAKRQFSRGDFVRWKHAMGYFTKELSGKLVFMFWRVLDGKLPYDRLRIDKMDIVEKRALADPDCLVVCLHDGNLYFLIAEMAMLERVDPT